MITPMWFENMLDRAVPAVFLALVCAFLISAVSYFVNGSKAVAHAKLQAVVACQGSVVAEDIYGRDSVFYVCKHDGSYGYIDYSVDLWVLW